MLLCAIPAAAQNPRAAEKEENSVLAAVELMENEQYLAAADTLRNVVAGNPENDAAFFYLGIIAIRMQKPLMAEPYLTEATKLDSANFWYKYRLAQYYNIVGRKLQSMEVYEDLARRYPEKGELAEELLQTYLDANYLDEAIVVLRKIENTRGTDIQTALLKGEIYRVKDFDNLFMPFLKDTLLTSGELSPIHKGKLLLNTVSESQPAAIIRNSKAICDMFDQCIRDGFVTEESLSLGIWLSNFLDHDANFLDYSQRLIGLEGVSDRARLDAMAALADYWATAGDTSKAFKMYEAVLKEEPANMLVLNNYAYFLSLSGKKLKKAYEMSARVVQENPENMTYLDTFGWILHLMGRDLEAKPFFKRAMAAGGTKEPVILDHYADVLFGLKEYDTAFYYYDQAVRKDKTGLLKGMDEKIKQRQMAREAESKKRK